MERSCGGQQIRPGTTRNIKKTAALLRTMLGRQSVGVSFFRFASLALTSINKLTATYEKLDQVIEN